MAAATVGTVTNDAAMKDHAYRYLQGLVRFGAFPDGSPSDQARWSDCSPPCIGSAWGHAAGMLENLVGVADIFARRGDTSLYTYTTPAGTLFGLNGGSISNILVHWAKMANLTLVLYGTTSNSQLTNDY
jgi:hypothetical protein